ncbi:MMPL family transporter [Cellulomonas alba]|uniref:MMPL family transporter n=1 Tax=Cellulomonas alba TaxID=3053467 RepID=A0ABT7SB69_9CELL|nr:MMPL family transporter [Cellulomonas alba]MDM7853425.1 MMPL family transporter [Cellulomonas alba]
MFARLGRAVALRPRVVVAVWIVLAVLGYALAVQGVHGENLFERLHTGAPTVPGSESAAGRAILDDQDDSGASLTLVLQGVDVSDPAVAAPVATARSQVAAIPGVASVVDPLALPDGADNAAAAPLVARDGQGMLMIAQLEPGLSDEAQHRALGAVEARFAQVPADLHAVAPEARGIVGGTTLVVSAITEQVKSDLRTGEAIALPIALLVMLLVFGGFLAAAMPLAGAIASIAGGLAALLALSYWIDLDSSVVNVVTVLGLGLSIDYGLLIVSRFREELTAIMADEGGTRARRRRGDGAVLTAIEATMATAGRTVAFSALTVAIAIAGLLAFSPPILRSFGGAGVAIVLIALATAMTLVPALLALAGRRLGKPSVIARVPLLRRVFVRTSDVQHDDGLFSRLAAWTQRRPWIVLAGTLVLLGVLAAPLAHIELRNSTTELLPLGSQQREYVQVLARDYPAATSPAITVVAQGQLAEVQPWAQQLGELDGVASVDPPKASGSYVTVGVRPASPDGGGPTARQVVREIRALDPQFPTWVTGQAASEIDFTHAVGEGAPWAIAIVALATLVLLFLMTGSVVMPVKALLTNAVSIAASLGVLVWAFQDGHLAGLLNFEPTGGIETYVVALVIAFAFGLAMDYEVFLLSRIQELVRAGVPNDEAVRRGLQRSGRIITSAAAIVVVVFAGFVAGKLLVIKEVGFALAVAVTVDATVVRLLLVPATMTLLGRWNWWAPAPLRRLHERWHLVH